MLFCKSLCNMDNSVRLHTLIYKAKGYSSLAYSTQQRNENIVEGFTFLRALGKSGWEVYCYRRNFSV